MANNKVLLGMSGGVDSSVSALILKQQGYDVMGITLELFAGSCCNIETTIDAKGVCKKMGIPHITYEQKEKFRKCVIDDFINEYAHQRTPNPCIECNKYLKFGSMYDKAKELGCEYIATGHYARMVYSEKYGRYAIKKAKCIAKDQTYVLYNMPKELLGKVLFPLGDFESKEEVRKVASENKLATANKPDSEDICFITDGNYAKFLETNSYLKPKKGNIVTKDGKVLGQHNGLYKYTIGQRKGLGISYKVPLYVIGYNSVKNELIVGEKEDIYKNKMIVDNVNLLLVDNLNEPMHVGVKIRYSSKEEPATIVMNEKGQVEVTFDNPVARITPGQSAVFYTDDLVVGGGKILK